MNAAQQEQSFSFTLAEWHIIRAGLLELPGKIGLPVLFKLEPHLVQASQAAQILNGQVRNDQPEERPT